MPKEAGPSYLRGVIPLLGVVGHFDGNGAETIINTFVPGFVCSVEKLLFVPSEDFAGAGGTLTFDLRKGGATGTIIATLTIALAAALQGAKLSAAVSAANETVARLSDTDGFSITRQATGTAFTGAAGQWMVLFRQRAQAKV